MGLHLRSQADAVLSLDDHLPYDLPRILRAEPPSHHPRVPRLPAVGLSGSQREAALVIGPPGRLPAARARDDAPLTIETLNVELIAAEKIGRETVTYVSNIYKYYLAYQMITEQREEREKAKETVKQGARK
jgi:hypothetical protein